MRYALFIEYDGNPFAGWQRQKTHLTVQEVVEVAFSRFIPHPVPVVGASRTDSGVHALQQVAHLDLESDWDPNKLRSALNFYIKNYPVRVVEIRKVPLSFSARRSAKVKEYFYKIMEEDRPLHRKKAWFQRHPLNINLMDQGARFLIGTHDFSSFRSSECQARTAVKTLDSICIKQEGRDVLITFTARSFLQHQIRKMVGTLVLTGHSKIPPSQVRSILKAKDKSLCTSMAPPWGLYLSSITYE